MAETMETKERKVKFFPQQWDAFNSTTQFTAAIAGSQGGKSLLGSYWTGKKIQEFPDKNGCIIAPTYKLLQQATLEKFFQIFPELRRYYKEQKGVIELPTGGKVFIRSADSPLGLEGMTINFWWYDEAGMGPRLSWVVLRTRVSITGGQGLITTTPHFVNWLYDEFYLPWKTGKDKNFSVFTWKSIDNPYFNKEFYEAERGRLRPEEFARRYEGEFKKMEGLVYDIPADQIINPLDLMARAEARIMGIDWGFRNPAAIGVYYKYDNAWYVVDEWKNTEKTTAEIIEVAKALANEHRIEPEKIYPDPAEPDRIEECKRAGLPVCEQVNNDIKTGVSYIQELIRGKRLFVFNNCHEHLDEFNSYHYPEDKDNQASKDEPEKFNDHLMSCLRYAIFTYPREKQAMAFTQPIENVVPKFYPELGF